MFKHKLIILTLTASLLTPVALAKMAPEPGRDGMRQILDELDLSSEQQSEIRALLDKQREERRGQRGGNRAQMRTEMEALITADTFDEAKARAVFQQHSEQMEENMVRRAEMHHHIYQLLNKEQQAKFLELLDQRREEMRPEKRTKGKQ